MYKLLFVFVIAVIGCSGDKTDTSTDILMDSVQLKQKADSTIQQIDHLQDSVDKLRKQAAEKAGN